VREASRNLYLHGRTVQDKDVSDGGMFSEAHSMQHNNNHNLTIVCDACGNSQSRDVERLHEMSHLLCPGCGNQINLRKEPWKGDIQRMWNAAHDRGPSRRRLP